MMIPLENKSALVAFLSKVFKQRFAVRLLMVGGIAHGCHCARAGAVLPRRKINLKTVRTKGWIKKSCVKKAKGKL